MAGQAGHTILGVTHVGLSPGSVPQVSPGWQQISLPSSPSPAPGALQIWPLGQHDDDPPARLIHSWPAGQQTAVSFAFLLQMRSLGQHVLPSQGPTQQRLPHCWMLLLQAGNAEQPLLQVLSPSQV